LFRSKIKTISELGDIIKGIQADNKKVVLCHGCFDLVHIGHIKHFHAAKQYGDVLVVTVTPDRFINKGPGRPIFKETYRLETLSNLEVVDYVALNDDQDAVSVLNRLRPDFYIKGDEYKDSSKDVTGKISEEKRVVESYGGKFAFTEEVTFSSTSLINSHFDYLPLEASTFLNKVRKIISKEEVEGYFDVMRKLKIAIVGDLIIDEYMYCKTVGTITKSPAISAVYKSTLKMAGGSLAVARHVAEFVDKVDLISIVGGKNAEEAFIKGKMDESGITCHFVECPERFTPLKRRFVTRGYPNTLEIQSINQGDTLLKIFEIGFLDDGVIDKSRENELCMILKNNLSNYDLVIGTDFGHGVFTKKVIEEVRKNSRWLGLNVQTNSTNFGFNLVNSYYEPDFLCMDELESRLPFSDRYSTREEIILRLSRMTGCNDIMMTIGKDGLIYKNDEYYYAPVLALNPVDTIGAGDAVLSMASLCRYIRMSPMATILFSAVMGALASNIICNVEPVRKMKFMQFINGILGI